MQMLGRTGLALGLASMGLVTSLAAQGVTGFDSYKWYFGGQGGIIVYGTPNQTRGAVVTVGGHLMVTAKRTAIILEAQEGIARNHVSSYADPSAPFGTRQVVFNDLRKYSASVVVFPFNTVAQPYLGLGFGLLETVKEYPTGTFYTLADRDAAYAEADRLGGYTYGAFVGGVQIRLARFVAFGQYMLTTLPPRGRLIVGSTHTLTAGLRIGLGDAREDWGNSGGGR